MSSFDSHQPGSVTPVEAGNTTSDERVFTEEWRARTRYSEQPGIHITTEKMYVGDGDKIIVYDILTRQQIKEIATRGGHIRDISQSIDGKCLFIAVSNGTASIVDLDTGEEVILCGHTRFVNCVIQGEGTDVLTGSTDNTIRRWNSLTGVCLQVYRGHAGPVVSIIYDAVTRRIFSASVDNTIIVWNGETDEKIRVMEGHDDRVNLLARVDSTTIASCSDDGTIKLWNMMTLACIKTISDGSDVNFVAATPDGQHLISGSDDNNVKVWSVATGQCTYTLSHHREWVVKVAVSPDGRFIASSAGDQMFHLFSVSPSFLS